ncbi:MAG: phage major capsid protein [Asticcacaulis sp.]|nr:phage major capsid protein [Asticcacaulis sp.]
MSQSNRARIAPSYSPSAAKLRGLVGPAFAAPRNSDEDAVGFVRRLGENFEDFKVRQSASLDEHREEIDRINIRLAAIGLNGIGGGSDVLPADPSYTETFNNWTRSGQQEGDLRSLNATGIRSAIQAAMTTSPDTAGGYLAPIEWDRKVNKALEAVSPMRRIARVVPTTVRAYSTLYRAGGWASGWVGETDARPATDNATLASLTFPNGEIYAKPSVTQQLLDDADFKIEQWLADEISEEFAKQEGVAFISGNGTNKPRGLLTYVTGGASAGVHPSGNITVVPSGAASALPDGDGLIDFVYGLTSPYRQNAKWLMNSMTAAAIAKFKDGDGNYLWRETYVAGQPATLLGYPVEIDENMPDVGAGNLPIAFGDFKRAYVINDRIGLRLLRDPYTNKPYVDFYATKRVGGGLDDPKAVRLLKIAAS